MTLRQPDRGFAMLHNASLVGPLYRTSIRGRAASSRQSRPAPKTRELLADDVPMGEPDDGRARESAPRRGTMQFTARDGIGARAGRDAAAIVERGRLQSVDLRACWCTCRAGFPDLTRTVRRGTARKAGRWPRRLIEIWSRRRDRCRAKLCSMPATRPVCPHRPIDASAQERIPGTQRLSGRKAR